MIRRLEDGTLTVDTDAEVAQLDAIYPRVSPDERRWRVARKDGKASFADKARAVVQAGTSFVSAFANGTSNEATVAARLAACAPCPHREVSEGKAYCSACSCPKWRWAELEQKATLAGATCPKGFWPTL